MSKKSLKILVDEMDDGMDEKLEKIGFDAYSVKKLRAEGLNLHTDFSVISYAKENNMILVTRDTENGEACSENNIPCILLDNDEIFKIRKKYRCRILIKYPKDLFIQKYLSEMLNTIKLVPGIKLEVDVDPINFS